MDLLTLDNIQAARERLRGVVLQTPIQPSDTFSRAAGNRVYLKPESLQKTGSFKLRGAFNKVATLSKAERSRGVITASSGNHGQAVAYAAHLLGARSIVVMPEDAPDLKRRAARAYGAELVFHGHLQHERKAFARDLARDQGLTYVDSTDDFAVMAGQGTAALEMLEQVPDVDVVVAPIGSGGLMSGIASAVKLSRPDIRVIGVQPRQSAAMKLSVERGCVTQIENLQTIADGLRSARPGELTFPHVQQFVDDIILVEESEIIDTVILLAERAKLVVEPSGAVSLAGVIAGKLPVRDKNVVCLLSGGNMDLEQLRGFLQRGLESFDGRTFSPVAG